VIEPGQGTQRYDPENSQARPRPAEPWLKLAPLVILGGISGIAYYLGFVVPYRMADYYKQPLMDLAKINSHSPQSANAWALTWIVLFVCYFLAFRLCPPSDSVSAAFRRVGLFIICGWAAFSSINMLFMYPVGAADIFDQIFRARLFAHYHLNPFTTVPNSILNDPLQDYVAWKGDPSPYGPAWELLSGGTSFLAGGDLWRNLVLFKLLVIVAYGISIALTYGILRATRPDWALRGTLFFAWNPLVIFEVAGNGHNDAVVVMFMLAGVYAFVLARRYFIIPALMAAALAKFVPVLLIPVAAAALWRDRYRFWILDFGFRNEQAQGGQSKIQNPQAPVPVRRKSLTWFDSLSTLAISSVAALGLAAVMYAPFWEGSKSLGPLGRQSLFTASIPKVVLEEIEQRFFLLGDTQKQFAESLVRNGALAFVVLVVVFLSVNIFLKRNATTPEARAELVRLTLRSFYEVIFFYLAFATLWWQPWYLLWLIALTAPTASFTNANRTILFCIGGVLNYFVWDYLWLWNGAPFREIQITSALVIYTLPLAYTLFAWTRALAPSPRPAAA
jgi:hypothetical protein